MEMIEVKTSELSGLALDWAVAEAIGANPFCLDYGFIIAETPEFLSHVLPIGGSRFHPSLDWAQGGPLIEKYLIAFCVEHEDVILAVMCDDYGMYVSGWRQGENHLIAACRAIVAAKLGDAVLVPAALIGGDA